MGQDGIAAFNVRTFGAKGDGKHLDSEAIQTAIDKCSSNGGGKVLLTAGKYLCGTILLKDNVTLDVGPGAVVLGSKNLDHYRNVSTFTDAVGQQRGKFLIGAVDAKNIGIEGSGVIDGQGSLFRKGQPGWNERPFLVRFVRCSNISVTALTLQNPAAWTSHYFDCEGVRICGLTIRSEVNENNDAIDIDSCRRVRISDCDIRSSDDSICLKTTSTHPCRDVVVSNCIISSNWGAIKFGTESAGPIENVSISNCAVYDTLGGGIKILSVDGAQLRNVTISDITMDNVVMPIFIRLGARMRMYQKDDDQQTVGVIKDVSISNIRAKAISMPQERIALTVKPEYVKGVTNPGAGIFVTGIAEHFVENLVLDNIHIIHPGGESKTAEAIVPEMERDYPEFHYFGRLPAYGVFVRHAKGLLLRNIRVETEKPDFRHGLVCEDVENILISNFHTTNAVGAVPLLRLSATRDAFIRHCHLTEDIETFCRVEGRDSKAITLVDNDLRRARSAFETSKGAEKSAVIASG